jgi:hypothetical protein
VSKFEVGQRWKIRCGEIVEIIKEVQYKHETRIVVFHEYGKAYSVYCNGKYLPGAVNCDHEFDLVERHVETKYRPFASAAEFDPYREKWIANDGTFRAKVIWYSDTHIFTCRVYSWHEAFELFTFEDGAPFGIEVAS